MGNHSKITGIVAGFILYLSFVLIFSLAGNYLSKSLFSMNLIYYSNPAMQWVILGSVPLFFCLGLYLFKDSKRWETIGIAAGFFIWLIVILCLQIMEIYPVNYGVVMYPAGYGVILGFCYLFKRD